MRNATIKVFTLLIFLTLIFGFVAYQSGCLSQQKPVSAVGQNGNNQDQPKKKKDTLGEPRLIPSSKVMILRDHSSTEKDSGTNKPDTNARPNKLMHSSKSGLIMTPENMKLIRIDSFPLDSTRGK